MSSRLTLRSAQSNLRTAIRLALGAGSVVIAAGVGTLPAQAQQVEEIFVTGSRIARDANLAAPTQVTTIDADVISQSGLINVADVLRAVPSFGVSALSTSNSNFLTTSSGINTLELRNLEEDRTLVLVNGRRYVSGLPGTSAVDFNTIPTELVDRIEIITGGASAVYGSDALAGVINVILKDDFEGVSIGYQTGAADLGGDVQKRLTITAGGNFADDRGNAVVSLTATENDGLLARDRPNTAVDDIALCLLTGVQADCQTEENPFFSSFSEYGRFFVPSTGASFTVPTGVGPTGTVAPWSTATYGFNRQHFRRYTVPTDRYLLSTLVDYELADGITAFVEGTFTQTRTKSELEPFPHSNSDLSIGGISVDNPFVPPALRNTILAAGDNEIQYFRRTTELDQRGSTARRNTYRLLFGFEGEINDRWTWESFYGFGRMDDAQQGTGQINVLNMREALNAIDGDGDPGTFDPVCANPAAVAEGCVPINLFGLGSISPDAAAYVRAPQARQQLTQQQVFGTNFTGPLGDNWAGTIQLAAGAEWRREIAEDVPDVLTQQGLNGGNAEAPTFGEYDVGEVYLEVEVPLISDKRLAEELSVGLAYRHSDYSTVDTTDANAFRLSWSPTESVRLRAQVARAVRAPNINELFAPGGENFAPVSDPCNNVTATTPGQIADNCRSIPAIAQRIAATGAFTLTQTEIQGTGGFTGRGNPRVRTETSDSSSLGVVFNNDSDAGGITVSVDYFDIEIKDLIDTVDRQTSVSFCYNTPPSSFPNDFCQFVVRDAAGAAFQLGEITEVNSGFVNEGTLETTGVDLSFLWSRDANWIRNAPGQASVRLNYTRLLDFVENKFGAADDLVGETGYAEDKWQAAFVYGPGRWNLQWQWTHIGDSVPDKSEPLFDFGVGSYDLHDIQASYAFKDNAKVYFGLNNALDEEAPIILTGIPGNTTGTDTDASVYNPIGRTWYAGMQWSFGSTLAR